MEVQESSRSFISGGKLLQRVRSAADLLPRGTGALRDFLKDVTYHGDSRTKRRQCASENSSCSYGERETSSTLPSSLRDAKTTNVPLLARSPNRARIGIGFPSYNVPVENTDGREATTTEARGFFRLGPTATREGLYGVQGVQRRPLFFTLADRSRTGLKLELPNEAALK